MLAAFKHIQWRDIAQARMQPALIVVCNVRSYLLFEILQVNVTLLSRCFVFTGLEKSFDLAVALGIKESCFSMNDTDFLKVDLNLLNRDMG